MKNINILFSIVFLFTNHLLFSQDALTMNDLNFDRASYNSSFIAAVKTPMNASLTSSLGNGVQNTSKVNFLAYANIRKMGFGVGIKLNSKFYGLFRTNTAEFLYAKALKINDDHHLFAGLNVGMHFSGLDDGGLNSHVNYEDPFLVENQLPQYRLTTGLGVGYTFKNKIKAGISMPSFLRNKNDFFPVFVINTSYRKELASEVNLIPQLLLYGTNNSAPTLEGNLTVNYKDYLNVKIGGRTTKTMILGLGWQVKFLNIGYNYNMNFAEYSEISPMVHNVNVRFNFFTKKSPQTITETIINQPVMDEHNHDELEEQRALIEALERAHEKDRKELEGLIAQMKNQIEENNRKKQKVKKPKQVKKDDKEETGREEENENPEVELSENPETPPSKTKPAVAPQNAYKYYVVVAAFKNAEMAADYQNIFEEEYDYETNIVLKKKGSWNFIYTSASDDYNAIKSELRKVKSLAGKKLITGTPWIYAK